ncbi:ABC transporter substrate-binding protein [Arthrobacter sp. NtRootA1]|uniref:ABC transporter substrate-binding protein n=1 Tax=Arthrobacter sp. NtRootA1 TaxID=2830983 RepID=UPI001CC4F580|nr:ABC transporter substrate-binding protein [Arthrobacter sp. NtRootA1]BCW05714.1 peptide ABC transporter substrate-binding protein [Arthrobacter sp. NtRootA1]
MDNVRASSAEGIDSPQACQRQGASAEDAITRKTLRSRIKTFFAAGTQGSGGKSSASPVRGGVLLAGFLVVGVAMSGCSGTGGGTGATAEPYTKDTVTFATSVVPPSLNPAVGDPAYAAVYQWAYDPLVVMNGDGTFSPGLAEKFGYVGEGNQTYEIALRKGLTFSDGSTLDAEALKKNLDYSRAQTLGTPSTLLASVEKVEVTDPLTVRLTLSRPDPGLSFYFAQAFGAGYPISPASLDKPATLDAATAGAGPYMLDSAQTVAGDHYTFVKNPKYWNPERQHFNSVTVRVIANPSSTIQAMQAGQVQAALGDATTLPAARAAGLEVIAPPQALSGINLADREGKVSKPLGNLKVRQALNMAVDRKTIAKALYGSEDLALSQYALKGQAPFSEELTEKYPYDPEKAKALLAEAGYPDGFTLPVLTTSLAGLDKLTQAVGGQLEKVGVKLELTTQASAPDYFTAMVSGKYPAAVIGYGLADMNSLYAGFVNPAGPFNWFKTSDPKLDELYNKYRAADEKSGVELQKQINERLMDQAWTIPVVGAPLSYYLAPGLTGFDATSANAAVPLFTDLRPAK